MPAGRSPAWQRRRASRRPPRPRGGGGSRKSRCMPVPRQQRPSLRHARRIDLALDLLRQRIGVPAVQAAERDLRMRFEDAHHELGPPPEQPVELADLRKDAEGLDRDAARRLRSGAGNVAARAVRVIPGLDRREWLDGGVDALPARESRTRSTGAGRACAAPSLSGPRPPWRVNSGRPIGMSTATRASAGSIASSASKLGKHRRREAVRPGRARRSSQPCSRRRRRFRPAPQLTRGDPAPDA